MRWGHAVVNVKLRKNDRVRAFFLEWQKGTQLCLTYFMFINKMCKMYVIYIQNRIFELI